MIRTKEIFTGFTEDTIKFLSDLEKNNNIEWFHKNKSRYQNSLVKPARLYVTEMAPLLNRLNPAIRTEPKFNKTLMRLNKDMRFAKGEPYRTYFLIHFGRFKLDSEFFLYFAPAEVQIGVFLNKSNGDQLYLIDNLKRYRDQFINTFADNNLNGKYSLYNLNQGPEPVIKKFHADKHFDKLNELELIILQKVNSPAKSKIFSDELLPYSVKLFTELYPVLCFAYFKDPLLEIQKFKDSFGVIL